MKLCLLALALGSVTGFAPTARRGQSLVKPKTSLNMAPTLVETSVDKNGLVDSNTNVAEPILQGLVGRIEPGEVFDRSTIVLSEPETPMLEAMALKDSETTNSFAVEAAGAGSLSGVTYTAAPYSKTKVTFDLAMPCMTSAQVDNLRTGWEGLLSASQKTSYESYVSSDTSASANLSFLGFFSGGAKATTTVKTTSQHMQSLGLTETQITKMIDMFAEAAAQMNHVKYEATVLNMNNPFAVSGQITVYVMSGTVTTSNGQTSKFAMVSDGGIAGAGGQSAPASGDVVPLT